MIRIKATEAQAQIPILGAIVLVMLFLALALSVAAVQQVMSEYHLLVGWEAHPERVSSVEIGNLRRDIGARIIVRSTAFVVLLLSTLALLWFQQRQLAVLRMLHHVKLLALDILASLDQGVIATDLFNIITGINSAAIRILGLQNDCVG